MDNEALRIEIEAALLRRARKDEIFQSPEVLQELKERDEDFSAHAFHSFIQHLLSAEMVQAVPGLNRKRNKYWMVSDAAKLEVDLKRRRAERSATSPATESGSQPSGGAQALVTRLQAVEERVDELPDIEDLLVEVRDAVAEVRSDLDEIKQGVERLTTVWS